MYSRVNCTNTPAASILCQSKPLEPVRAFTIVLAQRQSIMSFRLDNAMSVVLSSCSCTPAARLVPAFEKPPSPPFISSISPFAFPHTLFPRFASSPTLNPIARSFQTDVALRLSVRSSGATTAAYDSPPCSGIRQMSCKKFARR